MYLHTNIPLPLPDTPSLSTLPREEAVQEKRVMKQRMSDEARAREERMRQASVPSMTDFFHVSRLPNKQRA